MDQVKEEILHELNGLPDRKYSEVLDFIRFLKSQRRRSVPETVHASEAILRKDWLLPEEDEAWSDL